VVTLNRDSSVLQSWRMSNVTLNCLVSPGVTLNRDGSALQSWRMSNVALNCLISPGLTLNRDSSMALNCVVSPGIAPGGDRYVSARTVSHVWSCECGLELCGISSDHP